MSILLINIKSLLQAGDGMTSPKRGEEMSRVQSVDDAYLLIGNDNRIAEYGRMDDMDPKIQEHASYVYDVSGRIVLPCFCDSHTHLVYAGNREQEFVDKIKGLSYGEIAARGGGILNSAALLHTYPEEELFEESAARVREVISKGTGALEIKSGYGLNLEDELKILRVIRRISDGFPLPVRATFLGAHAVPGRFAFNRKGYVSEIVNSMLPEVAKEGLASYCDVFCEKGFFSVEDTEAILDAAAKYGIRGTVHADQMSCSGGVEVGIRCNAVSVCHLEYAGDAQIKLLASSDTIATLLPGSTFFMNMKYARAGDLIRAGAAVALASNYNPGSSPYGDMLFMLGLACVKYGLTPEEALNAATINGACAMGLGTECGSVSRGKLGNVIITEKIPSLGYMPYAFTSPLINTVILGGHLYGKLQDTVRRD
ncbi:MAG: imidazolonepropionase [Bacteroidales bacterium]|jgi:imidazolonepropionase|nr:imidazolonepropionase [Bacteroidales bacterium]MCI2145605.1 imidazolonepropionase [Bacteroidales bacterium]